MTNNRRQRNTFLLTLCACMILYIPSTLAFSNPVSKVTVHGKTRRNTINIIGSSFASVFILPNQILDKSTSNANALPFGKNENRRQLELCLVTVLRIRYWAETVALSIANNIENAPPTGMTDLMKAPYIEARLGAKAVLTGRVGGGANARVFQLAPIQLRECIKDANSWYNEIYKEQINDPSLTSEEKANLKKERFFLQNASEDIIESLAAVVEFDGLDNTQDPSPRSSLALSMYNDSKATFVKRLLLERTVTSCDTLVRSFGAEKRIYCEKYIKQIYPSEVPASLKKVDSVLNAESSNSISSSSSGSTSSSSSTEPA
jgi:hypothetical protein